LTGSTLISVRSKVRSRLIKHLFLFAGLWIIFSSAVVADELPYASAPDSLPGILESMKKANEGIHDLYFHYVEIQHSGDMNRISSGEVFIRRPHDLRLVQNDPEEMIVKSDGKTVWIYSPAEGQELVGSWTRWLKMSSLPLPALGFLDGKQDWAKKFEASLEDDNGSQLRLKLVPKSRGNLPVTLWIDKNSWLPVRGRLGEGEEFSEIQSSGMKVNAGLNPDLFQLQVPERTAVIPIQ